MICLFWASGKASAATNKALWVAILTFYFFSCHVIVDGGKWRVEGGVGAGEFWVEVLAVMVDSAEEGGTGGANMVEDFVEGVCEIDVCCLCCYDLE